MKVLVFTAYDDDERMIAAVQAGAQRLFVERVHHEMRYSLPYARLVRGGRTLQPEAASRLMREDTPRGSRIGFASQLTPRELDVLGIAGKRDDQQRDRDRTRDHRAHSEVSRELDHAQARGRQSDRSRADCGRARDHRNAAPSLGAAWWVAVSSAVGSSICLRLLRSQLSPSRDLPLREFRS